eukprot:COSAG06_NODE_152_length_21942_cov_4.593234_28_plen_34_part_00
MAPLLGPAGALLCPLVAFAAAGGGGGSVAQAPA